MTISDCTQPFSNPPKQPLFLSHDVLRACYDIDKNGFELASTASLEKFAFLASCLTAETIQFIRAHPHTKPAGMVLNVEVLLPVWERVNDSSLMDSNGDEL